MKILDAAKGILATVAPTLATAVAGPMGGMAVRAILPALGLKDNASEEQVNKAIENASPEQLLAIKKAEQEFQVKMRELDVDIAKLVSADKDSARKREIETKDSTPKILAYGICLLYASVQIYLFTHVIDSSMREMIMRALGTLDAILGLVFSYYFGSSLTDMTNKSKKE